MIRTKIMDPYSTPANLRDYVYTDVILAWETKRVTFNPDNYSKTKLASVCGIHILNLRKLIDVQLQAQNVRLKDEFLVFHHDKVKGYECLFKRLRDAFAHGHYMQPKRGWVEIFHQYGGNIRFFGQIKIDTLKKLVVFINVSVVINK